jgi:hypothetical protein
VFTVTDAALGLKDAVVSDSVNLMSAIEELYPEPDLSGRSLAPAAEIDSLYRLERELFSSWCSLCFRPSPSPSQFLASLKKVDAVLAASSTPYFLSSPDPTKLDFLFVSHLERMLPTALYTHALRVRANPELPALDGYLDAFDGLP